MFMYNTEYTSCLYRIKIPLLAAASEAAAVQEQPVPPAVMEVRSTWGPWRSYNDDGFIVRLGRIALMLRLSEF